MSEPVIETARRRPGARAADTPYRLEEQVGFLLRRAHQRHLAIFARLIPELTRPQWAALAMLFEKGDCPQSRLGARTVMDAATIKGVIDRLHARGLVHLAGDEGDRRRVSVSLTEEGRALVRRLLPAAQAITGETLAPLSSKEAEILCRLLERLG